MKLTLRLVTNKGYPVTDSDRVPLPHYEIPMPLCTAVAQAARLQTLLSAIQRRGFKVFRVSGTGVETSRQEL